MTSNIEPTPGRRMRLIFGSPIAVITSGARMMLALLLCAGFFLVVSTPATAGQDDGEAPNGVNGGPAKVYVCKYVGDPKGGFTLGTGKQPLSVSANAIADDGKSFSDAHPSIVINEGATCPEPPNQRQPDAVVSDQVDSLVTDCARMTTITKTVTTTPFKWDAVSLSWVSDAGSATSEVKVNKRDATPQELANRTQKCDPPAVVPPIFTPPVVTPPVVTPPVVVAPPAQPGVVLPPAVSGPKPGHGVGNTPGNTPGNSPGKVIPGTSSNYPGTVVVSAPATVAVPTVVAAGLGAEAATASSSAATRSMSLFGGGLVFLVAGLLLSRRRVG